MRTICTKQEPDVVVVVVVLVLERIVPLASHPNQFAKGRTVEYSIMRCERYTLYYILLYRATVSITILPIHLRTTKPVINDKLLISGSQAVCGSALAANWSSSPQCVSDNMEHMFSITEASSRNGSHIN